MIRCTKCASSLRIEIEGDEIHCRSCGNVQVAGVMSRWPFMGDLPEPKPLVLAPEVMGDMRRAPVETPKPVPKKPPKPAPVKQKYKPLPTVAKCVICGKDVVQKYRVGARSARVVCYLSEAERKKGMKESACHRKRAAQQQKEFKERKTEAMVERMKGYLTEGRA